MSSTRPATGRWRTRVSYVVAIVAIVAAGAYLARTTLMLAAARVMLARDPGLAGQERSDGVAVSFDPASHLWVATMKNRMNEIWVPAKVEGVNYYSFGGPRTWFRSYSERSNPRSPYYQAWGGAYVIRKPDGTVPDDPQALVRELTTLDQLSWLEAMGDPGPKAALGELTSAGSIRIDGSDWPLWHSTYRTHSDLSARPSTPLAKLLGMPTVSSWPANVSSFHDVVLDGYVAWRPDRERTVLIMVYAVSASYPGQALALDGATPLARDELLGFMSSARLESVNK